MTARTNTRVLLLLLGVCGAMLARPAPAADESPAAGSKPKNVRIGYVHNTVAGVNRQDAELAMGLLLNRILARRFPNIESETIFLNDLETALKHFNEHRIDILSMTGLDYACVRSRMDAEPGTVAARMAGPLQNLVLLARKGQDLRALRKLEHRLLMIETGGNGATSRLWLDVHLAEAGFAKASEFFEDIQETPKASLAVLAVFFGKSQACVVPRDTFDTMTELNPQIGSKIQVLAESPGLVGCFTCFAAGLDEEIKKAFWDITGTLGEDPDGGQILLLFKVKHLLKFEPKHLRATEELHRKHQALNLAEGTGAKQ